MPTAVRVIAWGFAGAFLSLAVSQLGLFTVPVGALLALALTRTHGRGRELLGLIEGAGAICALVGALNLHYQPCPAGPVVLRPGQESFSCGGFDGTPWLVAGLATMLLAAIAYWWLAQRRRQRPALPTRHARSADGARPAS